MGMAIGLSLSGFIPVCCYPRFDFFILALNQAVNHLDKINLFDQFIHRQTTAQTVRYTTKELLDLEIKISQANKLINELEIDFYLIIC